MNNDLISREALKKAVEELVVGGAERLKDYYENGSKSDENSWIGGVYDAWELIDNAPIVEVRPQGEWIEFAEFVARGVCDDDFKDNSDCFAEIACRKLVKLGILKLDGDTYKFCKADMKAVRNE